VKKDKWGHWMSKGRIQSLLDIQRNIIPRVRDYINWHSIRNHDTHRAIGS